MKYGIVVVGFSGCGPAAGEDVDLAVGLERSGRRDHHDEQQRRPEHRHGDRPEPPDAAGAVDGGRLVQVAGDRLQAGGDEDEREAEVGPHARQARRRTSAVSGSCSQPGSFTDGKMLLNHPMLASAPTDGCRRNSHIRLATATEVATVEENTVRNAPIPRRYLSASTASPTPESDAERHA